MSFKKNYLNGYCVQADRRTRYPRRTISRIFYIPNVLATSACIKPANEIEDEKGTKLAVLGIGLDIEGIELSTFVGAAA